MGLNGGSVSQCFSKGTVSGWRVVGGLVGENNGAIDKCYSICGVKGRDSGGLVGLNNRGSISVCYSAGLVSGTAGGVGGLVGRDLEGSVNSSFWDIQTSGRTSSAAGMALSTAEMQTAAGFHTVDGWDFVGNTTDGTDDIWRIHEGRSYPSLWWEYWPMRASHPCPENGARVAELSPVLSWYEGMSADFHDVYFGKDWDLVSQGTIDEPDVYRCRLPLETTNYEPGELEYGTTYYWRVDEVNKTEPNRVSVGDVWSFTVPSFIECIFPPDGAVNVDARLLEWSLAPAQYAYDVYVGKDRETVACATPQSVGIYCGCLPPWINAYVPSQLELGKTYYWRIDAVEIGNPLNVIEGDVWSFTFGT